MRSRDRLAKGAIVRHDDDRAFIPADSVEQCRDRLHVEMIRRLIKQDHIVRRQAKSGECHARLLAAREVTNLAEGLLTHEAQGAHDGTALLFCDRRVGHTNGLRHVLARTHILRQILSQVLCKDAQLEALVFEAHRGLLELDRSGERLEDR